MASSDLKPCCSKHKTGRDAKTPCDDKNDSCHEKNVYIKLYLPDSVYMNGLGFEKLIERLHEEPVLSECFITLCASPHFCKYRPSPKLCSGPATKDAILVDLHLSSNVDYKSKVVLTIRDVITEKLKEGGISSDNIKVSLMYTVEPEQLAIVVEKEKEKLTIKVVKEDEVDPSEEVIFQTEESTIVVVKEDVVYPSEEGNFQPEESTIVVVKEV